MGSRLFVAKPNVSQIVTQKHRVSLSIRKQTTVRANTAQDTPRSQQTSPNHESSSTSTPSSTRTTSDKSHCLESAPSMERPIDKEYATGMDDILTAVEALQITQQKVQVQARLHNEIHTIEVPRVQSHPHHRLHPYRG